MADQQDDPAVSGDDSASFTRIYTGLDWAIVVVPDGEGWRVVCVPTRSFEILATTYGDILAPDRVPKVGESYRDVDHLLRAIRTQLEHSAKLRSDVHYRARQANRERRAWRWYARLLPGFDRLVKGEIPESRIEQNDERAQDRGQ